MTSTGTNLTLPTCTYNFYSLGYSCMSKIVVMELEREREREGEGEREKCLVGGGK
jgi:hypothetical protein